jgi:hypothetical protein
MISLKKSRLCIHQRLDVLERGRDGVLMHDPARATLVIVLMEVDLACTSPTPSLRCCHTHIHPHAHALLVYMSKPG